VTERTGGATTATAVAHPNIALVKYWGKRDAALNLPAVPSLSLTLDGYVTRTTVGPADADEVWLNGARTDDAKVRKVLDLVAPGRPPLKVVTTNDFPTGAGLASSASGFAALVVAADAALGARHAPEALSVLARRGSGSACRSIWGGLVAWRAGERPDGLDSHGEPLAADWDLRLLVAVVSDAKKAVGSTEGMERSRATSPLYGAWVANGPRDLAEAEAAVRSRDLPALGAVMERSTFAMHGTMTSSTPPLLYWQPATVALLHEVFALRARGVPCWATMDAGPQVKVLCAPDAAEVVAAALRPLALRVDVHRPGAGARVV
jgi:diphosphomevalonate decarboxylase